MLVTAVTRDGRGYEVAGVGGVKQLIAEESSGEIDRLLDGIRDTMGGANAPDAVISGGSGGGLGGFGRRAGGRDGENRTGAGGMLCRVRRRARVVRGASEGTGRLVAGRPATHQCRQGSVCFRRAARHGQAHAAAGARPVGHGGRRKPVILDRQCRLGPWPHQRCLAGCASMPCPRSTGSPRQSPAPPITSASSPIILLPE